MKHKIILLGLATLFLAGCGTTNTTTTTKYDESGNVTETTVIETETSDLASYINAGDGNATTLTGDVSKFTLGYNGVGLSWFSVNGARVKAPVSEDSNSAEALEKTAEVIKTTKTTIQTSEVAINSDVSQSTDDDVEDTETATEKTVDDDVIDEIVTDVENG